MFSRKIKHSEQGFWLWCLMSLSTIFQLYCGDHYSRNLFVDISFRFCRLFSLHSSLILLEKSINLSSVYILGFVFRSCSEWGPSWSWSWSYGSWIYNYLYNQYLSPLTLWVQIPLRRCVLETTLCDKACKRLVTGQWFSPVTPVSSTNKTNIHDI
jgi:hypothetical protein